MKKTYPIFLYKTNSSFSCHGVGLPESKMSETELWDLISKTLNEIKGKYIHHVITEESILTKEIPYEWKNCYLDSATTYYTKYYDVKRYLTIYYEEIKSNSSCVA